MPLPIAALIGLAAAAKGVETAGGLIAGNSKKKADAKQAALDRSDQKERDLRNLAADESNADPFRHSLAQLNAASAFDKLANTTQKTVSIPGLNPKFMPTLGGGYQPSAELRGAANLARTNTLAGQGTAPTMTNPGNYGKTGVVDLIAMLQKMGLIPPSLGVTGPAPAAGGVAQAPVEPERFALSF